MTKTLHANDFDPPLTGTQVEQVQEVINEALRARIAEEKTYPYEEGDTIVLGPGIFSAKDRTVVNWDGQNYVPQAAVPEILPLKAYKVRDAVEVLVNGDWFPGHVTEVNKGHGYLNVHTDRRGPITVGSIHSIKKLS